MRHFFQLCCPQVRLWIPLCATRGSGVGRRNPFTLFPHSAPWFYGGGMMPRQPGPRTKKGTRFCRKGFPQAPESCFLFFRVSLARVLNEHFSFSFSRRNPELGSHGLSFFLGGSPFLVGSKGIFGGSSYLRHTQPINPASDRSRVNDKPARSAHPASLCCASSRRTATWRISSCHFTG